MKRIKLLEASQMYKRTVAAKANFPKEDKKAIQKLIKKAKVDINNVAKEGKTVYTLWIEETNFHLLEESKTIIKNIFLNKGYNINEGYKIFRISWDHFDSMK